MAPSSSHPPPPTATIIIERFGTPAPTARPVTEAPPAAYLQSAEGREVRGGVGSYCWGGRCLDVLSPVSNADAFFLVVDEGYSFRFDGEKPSTLYEDWVHVDTDSGTVFENGRTWNTGYGGGGSIKPSGAGLYLVLVEAAWAGGRDASYAFYVQVP